MAKKIFEKDLYFMGLAIKQAKKAYALGEVPVGALVLSPEGIIIGRGCNKIEKLNSQSRHAEVIAIEKAGEKIGDWRLTGCTIYVTLEPCFLCFSLIALSRIENIVFGAKSPLFGYHIDKGLLPDLYQKHIKTISKGIKADEVKGLLREFFKDQRGKGGQVRDH